MTFEIRSSKVVNGLADGNVHDASESRYVSASKPPPRLPSFLLYGRVLFDLDIITSTAVELQTDETTCKLAYDITRSTAWANFENGRNDLVKSQAKLSSVAKDADALAGVVGKCLERQFNANFIALLRNFGGHINVEIAGNVTSMTWATLRKTLDIFPLHIKSHVSCETGYRLPYPTLFRHIRANLEARELTTSDTLFVTRSVDAQMSARACGFPAVLLDDGALDLMTLKPLLSDPLPPARAWLRQRAKHLNLETSITRTTIPDVYCQCLLLELTEDHSLVYPQLLDPNDRTSLFSWFCGARPKALWDHPPDLDCTSLAYLTLPRLTSREGAPTAHEAMNNILRYEVEESSGLLNTWLDHEKVRLDTIALANIMALFYAHGRGADISATKNFLISVLQTEAYDRGSHYYTNADFFLFAVSRLLVLRPLPTGKTDDSPLLKTVVSSPADGHVSETQATSYEELSALTSELLPILKTAVTARSHVKADALGLSCRIIAAARCGVRLDACLENLLMLQLDDGSWPAGVLYKFNRLDGTCWHTGLTVALAIRAIEQWSILRGPHDKAKKRIEHGIVLT